MADEAKEYCKRYRYIKVNRTFDIKRWNLKGLKL